MPFFRLTGTSIRSSTSGGIDTGAAPIRDLHVEVLENGLDGRGEKKAGTRKSGSNETESLGTARKVIGLTIMI